jgi:hypothetical protein
MGIFNIFKKKTVEVKKEKTDSVINNEEVIPPKKKYPLLIEETNFSRKYEEEKAFFEYIDFKVAGITNYQKEIKRAIKVEKDDGLFDEQYEGMKNKEILEDTYDEPIFQYSGECFSECELKLEEDNEYDSKAIAVYINDFKVGYVPKKKFNEGKEYIYSLMKKESNIHVTASLLGGKYKVNRDDESVSTGESDYRIECQVVIKTSK